MFYNFEYVGSTSTGNNISFSQTLENVLFIGKASESSIDNDEFLISRIQKYIQFFFEIESIEISASARRKFASDLYSNHRDSFREFLRAASQNWQEEEFISQTFGSTLPPYLSALNLDSEEERIKEYALAYRIKLLTEIVAFYKRSKNPNLSSIKITKPIYTEMVNRLQSKPEFRELSIRMRRVVALADKKDPDNVIKQKGANVQKFGCLFWILC
jgi:hypothetical protein